VFFFCPYIIAGAPWRNALNLLDYTLVFNEWIIMAKHKSWHGADIKKARKKKLVSLKKKLQRV